MFILMNVNFKNLKRYMCHIDKTMLLPFLVKPEVSLILKCHLKQINAHESISILQKKFGKKFQRPPDFRLTLIPINSRIKLVFGRNSIIFKSRIPLYVKIRPLQLIILFYVQRSACFAFDWLVFISYKVHFNTSHNSSNVKRNKMFN